MKDIKRLKRRILDISYNNKLAHTGSCITAVEIIDMIYKKKQPEDVFILSSGHAGVAWYVVLEAYEKRNAEHIFAHHGVHPDRCNKMWS
jgi:transketolase N-terminal domain/subunit